MYTFLLQTEACLNSRSLTELSSDPSDLSALTSAHFLVGGPIHQLPEPLQEKKSVCLGERWRHTKTSSTFLGARNIYIN